jgi:hypothetical protein
LEHLKDASIRKALTLPANIRLGWKDFQGQHSRLIQKFVNYGRKKFYNMATGAVATAGKVKASTDQHIHKTSYELLKNFLRTS